MAWFRFVRPDGWAPIHPLPVATPVEAWAYWERIGNNSDLKRVELCDDPREIVKENVEESRRLGREADRDAERAITGLRRAARS